MSEPIDMPTSWLRELDQAAQRREDEIVRFVLQQPDYPPLPACPKCDGAPTEIKQWVDETDFKVGAVYAWVGFKPCRHVFRVRAA